MFENANQNHNENVIEGRWKGAGFGDYRCSVCDEETDGRPEYCPHCHAYMGKCEEED